MSEMYYKNEFPDFDRKLWIPDGFEDRSWHNDVMPRVIKEVGNVCYSIWQNYEDPKLRERDGDTLYVFDIEVDETNLVFSYMTDSLDEIKRMIDAIVI